MKLVKEGGDVVGQVRDHLFGGGNIQVVKAPVFDSVFPGREISMKIGPVFGFLQGDAVGRAFEILVGERIAIGSGEIERDFLQVQVATRKGRQSWWRQLNIDPTGERAPR